jgi:hypothetical protein
MDKVYSTRTHMVVRALENDINSFKSKEEREDMLRQEYPYLSVIGTLLYLTNNTIPDITFTVNCLARYSTAPTIYHWNGIKNILRYLVGIIDLGFFFQKDQDSKLIVYADVGYLSHLRNVRSQTGYVFLHGGIAISWKSCKQVLIATSTNYSKNYYVIRGVT